MAEPRRLFLFERLRASSPKHAMVEKGEVNNQISDSGMILQKQFGNYRASEHRDRAEQVGSRSLSKSRSLGDTNTAAPWLRNTVNRSNSHTYTSATGSSSGVPVKPRRKKKH